MPNVLAGKRMLVTGGGTGLGRELAHALSAHGATVYICGRREGVLVATGGRVVPLTSDIRDPDSIDALMDQIWLEGPLNGLVNNVT
jgi:NAD(P)-dependent dehydrogenase (short-subunit alcohol dehydrogenase family)